MSVKDIDHGWNRIKDDLRILDGSYTKIGLQQGSKHKDEDSGEMSDLVVIGAVHEFGAPRRGIPQRSWLQSSYDKYRNAIYSLKEKVYGGMLDGRIDPKRGLRLIGEFFESKVKGTIRDLKTPPNAPATQAAKARKVRNKAVTAINNPLIDTGQMLQSVRHVEVF